MPKSKKTFSKKFLYLLIVIILAFLVYYFLPFNLSERILINKFSNKDCYIPPSRDATWTTYKNNLTGMCLSAPGYTVKQDKNYLILARRPADDVSTDSIPPIEGFSGIHSLTISIHFIKTNETLSQVLEPNRDMMKNIQETTIGGVPAIRYEWKTPGIGEGVDMVYRGYHIQIDKFPEISSRQNEFEDILSTIKFIE